MGEMPAKAISILKFVGTVSLGLLTVSHLFNALVNAAISFLFAFSRQFAVFRT